MFDGATETQTMPSLKTTSIDAVRLTLIAWTIASVIVAAEPVAKIPPPTTERVAIERLAEALSDDDFAAREAARFRLSSLAARTENMPLVREVLQARLKQLADDLEGRELIRSVLSTLPEISPPPGSAEPPLSTADIDTLLDDLDAPQFARREAAFERLKKAASTTGSDAAIMLRTKARLEKPSQVPALRRRVESLWDTAWGHWLQRAPIGGELPPISDEDIEGALDRLLSKPTGASAADSENVYASARRDLLYFLSRDDSVARTTAAVERRLGADLDAEMPDVDASERLLEIYDWSRPAMVAEFWEAGEHKAVQHLIIGIPNQPANAPKPSLFDRCDERTAHCVSGNSLSPGDWPVGVFFPHPSSMQEGAQFHLKNLPTPRRRLAYQFEVPIDLTRERQQQLDGARRADITRNTCRRWLEEKRLLTMRELDMLVVLDPEEVSRFAADYLATVPDERVPHDSPTSFGNGSSHGLFCYQLSRIGTATAGPALQKAIDEAKVLLPVEETPYRMDWVALLVLVRAHGWPGRDTWLAKHFDTRDAINIRVPEAAEVGASAAAAVVLAAGGSPSEFHLQNQAFDELTDLENPGFRFSAPEGREAVVRWFAERAGKEGEKSGL